MAVASLIDSLSKIGAIGGIISFVGVGLLILLVASQSRQIRAMREWIDAEPERQAEVAQRVIAEVQRRIAAARERRAGGPPAPGAVPPAPRPAGAPAPGTLGATPEAKAVAAAKAADSTSAPAEPAAPGSVPPPTPGEPPVFAPLTPAADAATTADDAEVEVDPAVLPVEPGQDTQPADALPPEYDPLAAATPAARAADPRFADEHFDEHYDEEPRGNRLLFFGGIGALVAGILIAGFLLFGGGGSDGNTTAGSGGSDGGGTAQATPTPKTGGSSSGSTPVDPTSVKVVVLNGTQVTGLAQRVTDQLSAKNYSVGSPNTLSSTQVLTQSYIQYRAGHAAEARQVAKDLGIASSQVQPIDANVSTAAPETANVVVVTGSDLASSSTTSGTTG